MSSWIAFTCLGATVIGALYVLNGRRNSTDANPATGAPSNGIPVYGLQHGRLNLRLPTESMWMNMGFWRGQHEPRDFPGACRALLRQVFLVAGLLETEHAGNRADVHRINLLDVGFGCGDQIIELMRGDDFASLHIRSYVGITSSKNQFAYAHTRLQSLGLVGDSTSEHGSSRIDIFRNDAAVPGRWTRQLTDSVRAVQSDDTWLLGLDSLYHLTPSRLPLYKFANVELGASIMAFDLLLARQYESLPFSSRLLLRLVCICTSVPYKNLMTEQDYRKLLIEAGYSAESIHFEDITPDVFSPLVRFLDIQHSHLKTIGMGLGAFRLAKLAFGWWADTGIVRGNIVVAKRGP